jgi:hypothetical protein
LRSGISHDEMAFMDVTTGRIPPDRFALQELHRGSRLGLLLQKCERAPLIFQAVDMHT